jgi:hypothetical protein
LIYPNPILQGLAGLSDSGASPVQLQTSGNKVRAPFLQNQKAGVYFPQEYMQPQSGFAFQAPTAPPAKKHCNSHFRIFRNRQESQNDNSKDNEANSVSSISNANSLVKFRPFAQVKKAGSAF